MGSNASAQQAVNASTLGLGTAAFEDIGTSGANVPLLNGANTVSGVETHTANTIISGMNRLYFKSGTGVYLSDIDLGAGAFPGVTGTFANTATFQLLSGNQIGTGDIFFIGNPLAGGWTIFRGNAGLGLELSTGIDSPIRIRPNGVTVLDATDDGVQIGSTGTRFSAIRQATATLTAGSVIVADTAIAAGDSIIPIPTGVILGGSLGVTINPGVGYTIDSTNALDARALTITIFEK